ncbi:transmembrane amino acid transporter protein, partial [Ostertagia ostertagi]
PNFSRLSEHHAKLYDAGVRPPQLLHAKAKTTAHPGMEDSLSLTTSEEITDDLLLVFLYTPPVLSTSPVFLWRDSVEGMTQITSSRRSTSRSLDKTSTGDGKQSSIVTMILEKQVATPSNFSFSLWNTMMGVSLLSMPWALYQAGFALGLLIQLLMCLLCLYTAYLVVKSTEGLVGLLGKLDAEERLYIPPIIQQLKARANVMRLYIPPIIQQLKARANVMLTVPIYVAVLVFPLLNFKSPTFFTKFNMLGTISIMYLLIFNGVRLVKCGINMNFSDVTSPNYVNNFNRNFPALTGMLTMSYFIHNAIITMLRNQRNPENNVSSETSMESANGLLFHNFNRNFPALTGMLTMSYFIHNAIITMLRNQRNPENNVRDLTIGYGLVGFSYIFVALAFYAAFPLPRNCIADNLLNNFQASNPMSAIARVLIFFQLLTILPLILYLIRSQVSCAIFDTPWPGRAKVLILNITVVCIGVLVAIYFPKVGNIIRYFGAFSGLMYTYALPCMVHMRIAKLAGKLTVFKIVVHVVIIIFGIANLVAQFFVR